jgi:serine/threonine-protein phosphatase 6 regulatory ankyrin repeat subunit B
MNDKKSYTYKALITITMLMITVTLFAADIHTVAGGGTPEEMATILEMTEDVDIRDPEGWTALHYAARYNDIEMVNVLLDATADVNAASPEGVTPLMLAMLNPAERKDAANLIQLFIDYGADIDAKDNQGWTPLLYAARYNPIEPSGISKLLQAGANAATRTEKGLLPLFYEARFSEASAGNVQLFRSEYYEAEYAPEVIDTQGKAAIMYAAANSSPRIRALQFLLYSGNMGFGGQTDDYGNTPLMVALANQGIPRAVNYLLEVTPRIRSYRSEYHPHKPNEAGWTALMIATRHDADPELIAMLLDPPSKAQTTKAKVNDALPENGWTPLMLASRYAKDPKTIELLLDGGADIEMKSDEGLTALMAATANPNPGILELLLQAGTDPTVLDTYGWTALDYAQKYDAPEETLALLASFLP